MFHLQRLLARVGNRINTVSEADITGEQIASFLLENLSKNKKLPVDVNLIGAIEVAMILDRLLKEKS